MQSMPHILETKRDGREISLESFEFICENINSIPREQLGAFLMACQINGLSENETSNLTYSMLNAGEKMAVAPNRVDKHSTGGVGDKMSIILAPALRAVGATVPMLAGRGLAHTGGTIDKLESIPGFNTRLTLEEMKNNPCFISRQTEDIAPADRILYSIRDITGTVPQIGLITASIISKKAAEGLEKLVLDVKCGSAAFMKTHEDARALARSMVATGNSLGMQVTAQITEMDNPIGNMFGNSHEIVECIECLKGQGPDDTMELVYAQADALGFDIREVISNGRALQEFGEMCERQGVSAKTVTELIDNPWSVLQRSDVTTKINAQSSGYLSEIDAYEVGTILCELGAGRTGSSPDINHGVGAILSRNLGEFVNQGDCLLEIHSTEELNESIKKRLEDSIKLSTSKHVPSSRIIEIIS